MSEAARSSFNTQLASVMESLLAAAVCEISRIFEGSLSDSRAEVAQGREEVVFLKRKLEVLEVQLKDASATSGTVTFTQVLDGGPGIPLLLPDLHFEGDPSHGDGHGQASRVKEDVEVTEMESVTFGLDRAVVSKAIKEELLDQDPEPLSVELTCPVGTSPGATEPVELKEEERRQMHLRQRLAKKTESSDGFQQPIGKSRNERQREYQRNYR
ncbi:hypothetical protein SKAU_G00032140 [Synaphobranchus kaupii]|uniref:Uncharacterized protein n=1 Tax=Synaphobranchus kaupii TaxID=118154 RepID=A0A9Q1JD94_SYNKA|nr:hypothetical protein SKAU_G00032140 [Synaphobranchus kaupii]